MWRPRRHQSQGSHFNMLQVPNEACQVSGAFHPADFLLGTHSSLEIFAKLHSCKCLPHTKSGIRKTQNLEPIPQIATCSSKVSADSESADGTCNTFMNLEISHMLQIFVGIMHQLQALFQLSTNFELLKLSLWPEDNSDSHSTPA